MQFSRIHVLGIIFIFQSSSEKESFHKLSHKVRILKDWMSFTFIDIISDKHITFWVIPNQTVELCSYFDKLFVLAECLDIIWDDCIQYKPHSSVVYQSVAYGRGGVLASIVGRYVQHMINIWSQRFWLFTRKYTNGGQYDL